ncbi:hypothetical protein SAMN04489761_3299 [Tenacibaculum sp. MAR_2009_124]|uniref:hypothetical protein n=1 Tax=Tenacibaculum sp. MAR_2009_124 TaxID=1250059 RepID=UPI0008984B24|nr:hypothetical protein [Tenacibaculum sp. MAR_2009_124]SEC55144.1 hypothetical protein SAMN04489761_3299 [Tenacibaculum sp. MAR_2009_124]
MQSRIIFVLLTFFMMSCSKNDQGLENLNRYLNSKEAVKKEGVIACAASDKNNTSISYIFYYPVPEARNIQYFETDDINANSDDFSQYKNVPLEREDVFNGYLGRFIRDGVNETWSVVTFEVDGVVHVSSPIKLKNTSKPTEWSSLVSIDYRSELMPEFSWMDGLVEENVIYFQVISNNNGDLLSGTYTHEKMFQYYKLDNVVLNVTRDTPPSLQPGINYGFTLMGVSEDNWVNLVIEKNFEANE